MNRFLNIFICLTLLSSIICYGQKNANDRLKNTINNIQHVEQQIKDSILNLIKKEKNDTLWAKLCFNYIEKIGINQTLKYTPTIIRKMNTLLATNKNNAKAKTSYLNIKADAKMWEANYYFNSDALSFKDPKVVEKYKEAIQLYKESGNVGDAVEMYINLAEVYEVNSNLIKQLNTLEKGLKYAEESKDNNSVSRMYVQLMLFYSINNDSVQTMNFIDKGLSLEKKINDPKRMSRGNCLIALIYGNLSKHKQAIEHLLLSEKLYLNQTENERERLWQTYKLLGDEYCKIKEYDKTIEAYNKAIEEGYRLNQLGVVFRVTLLKGRTYSLKGNTKEALKIHFEMLKLIEEYKQTGTVIDQNCSFEIAQDYFRSKDFVNAKKYLKRAYPIAKKNNHVASLYELEEVIYKTDSALNNYQSAFKHYQAYLLLKEKLSNDEVMKLDAKNKFHEEIKLQKQEAQKQKVTRTEEAKRQKVILFSVLGCLLLLGIFASLIFKNLQQSKKANKIIASQKQEVVLQKKLVEEKQKEITDSITYAKRIQQAILPPTDFITQHVPQNFVLYKPKDIVAGDFYWSEKIDNLFFIAAADCTGHGVPGAMVSVVCSNALNRSVKELALTDTAEILNKTRELVIETFEKNNADIKDGMDISLLCIDKQNQKIYWSGANNPLWYIQDNTLIEIKADKQPVGKSYDTKPFTTNSLDYKVGTTFYLFTDGFADQFGGPKGKKFKYKQLEEMFVSIKNKSMKEQEQIIEEKFNDWKGDLDQIDDVCVIGIKI